MCGAMAPEAFAEPQTSPPPAGSAKIYNRTKLIAGIASSGLSLAFLWVLMQTGFSRQIAQLARVSILPDYGTLFLFVLAVGVMESILTLPIGFYSGYFIEHRYALSNQSLGRWAWEHAKGALVAFPLLLLVLALLYHCLTSYGDNWWIPVGVGVTFLSVILARLAPILIMPLFYKFTPLPDGTLKERIARLCTRTGIRFTGIFSFNLSKNTKKANAGFTGIGRSKRIILGDTLVRDFTEEEIETVFAHELGHYKHHHIVIGMVTGTLSTFVGSVSHVAALCLVARRFRLRVGARYRGASAPGPLALPFRPGHCSDRQRALTKTRAAGRCLRCQADGQCPGLCLSSQRSSLRQTWRTPSRIR